MRKLYIFLGVIFNIYFVALQVASPSTFLGTIFGFNIVWFLISIFFFALYFVDKFEVWNKVSESVKNVIFGVVILFFIISSINLLFITHPQMEKKDFEAKYVIVLGGGITKNEELTNSVKRRVERAAEYLKENPNAIAVVTGGKGPFSPCPESDVLKPYLASCGIDENRILAENMAKDTIENFKYSAKLLSEHEGKTLREILDSPIAVVTSDFHIARSERLAKRMGFTNVNGVYSRTPFLFVLSSYSREICCYIKLNLRIMFTRQPSLLTS